MTPFRLILRNLLYFRGASLAVVAGVAVATAVLTGALMVGDSVRGSLRAIALERLGKVDFVLAGPRFFDDSADDSLARRITAVAGVADDFEIAPAVIVNGGAAIGEGKTRKVAGDVQVAAAGGDWVKVAPGEALLNDEAAAALGAHVKGRSVAQDVAVRGPGIVFSFPSMEDVPRDATIARRDPTEAIASLRVEHGEVDSARDFASLFNLYGGQRVGRNAWVNLRPLQEAVNQPARANVLLVHEKSGDGAALASNAHRTAWGIRGAARLNEALRQAVQLKDYGLSIVSDGKSDEAALVAKGTYLEQPATEAAAAVAKAMGFEPRLVTVNLVNRTVINPQSPTSAVLHYAIGAGISRLDDGPLASDEIAFNEETATQLGIKVGDAVRLDYFQRDAGGQLKEVSSAEQGLTFHVSRILPMTGLGADPSLTPNYKGLTDAASVSDWDPPKELGITGPNMKLAERDNDAYWKRYRAAPRFSISLTAAEKLWAGPYGQITSVRVPRARADEFARRVREQIDPSRMGLAFRAIKAEQLSAASGSTDFSMLFVGFSFFLIVAAGLLVAMLLRLNVERRARQLGVLAAVGFAPKRLRRLALMEGELLAVMGGLVGLPIAVGYTWLMMYGLRTWWVKAVGTTALRLYVEPLTLGIGLLASLAVAAVAIAWGVWRVGKTPPARLLAGAWGMGSPQKRRTGRWPRIIGIILGLLGVALLAAILARLIPDPEAALGAGALLLTAGLFWLSGSLRPRRHAGVAGLSTVTALGVRNASRHTARSVLSVGLIAFAAFTLITVASMKQGEPTNTADRRGGSGGYTLFIRAGVPILGDLNTVPGRTQAGALAPDDPRWSAAKFTALRRWAGQDISCLNLTRPASPTILGVPHSMVERGGFTFAEPSSGGDASWKLIETPAASEDEIPVFADHDTAAYILKLSVGEVMPITDQGGRRRSLKLVGTLSHSIFQSEMLMSEANFRRLFPAQAGAGVVLVETPAEQVRPVQQLLSGELEPYAVSIDTTAARLAAYSEIQNTYLSTFQALGSLGLALGTIGLAVVLIRNAIERRPELAVLSSLGFRPRTRIWLVLSENAFLLLLGLGVGAACALLGILPTLLQTRRGVAVIPLALTLIGVLALGMVAAALAVWVSGVSVRSRDLRSE